MKVLLASFLPSLVGVLQNHQKSCGIKRERERHGYISLLPEFWVCYIDGRISWVVGNCRHFLSSYWKQILGWSLPDWHNLLLWLNYSCCSRSTWTWIFFSWWQQWQDDDDEGDRSSSRVASSFSYFSCEWPWELGTSFFFTFRARSCNSGFLYRV